jgi:hypothetical protein
MHDAARNVACGSEALYGGNGVSKDIGCCGIVECSVLNHGKEKYRFSKPGIEIHSRIVAKIQK